jgi:hypothetical protein
LEGVFLELTVSKASPPDFADPFDIRLENVPTSVADIQIPGSGWKVCSLSACISEFRLWSHYADGHRGVALEIDFPDEISELPQMVSYVTKLPDPGGPLMTVQEKAQSALSIKTKDWEHEAEYRIIQTDAYYPVSGRVSAVYLGSRVSELHRRLLSKCIPESVSIITTHIDHSSLTVESGVEVERGL